MKKYLLLYILILMVPFAASAQRKNLYEKMSATTMMLINDLQEDEMRTRHSRRMWRMPSFESKTRSLKCRNALPVGSIVRMQHLIRLMGRRIFLLF